MAIESRSIRIETRDGVTLHCLRWEPSGAEELRAARPLVLLHGGGANAHWWDHLARELARHRCVHALDFRGHGDSEHPEERRVGAFNLDLEALVEFLGRQDVDLVGHSLGAAVALDHASRFEATHSIALIDLARGSTPGSRRRARLALSLRRTYPSFDEAVSRYRFLPESSHASEALRRHIARHSVRREADGRFGFKFDPAWFGLPAKPRPDLARVRCPVLLVRGAESALLSAEAAREFIGHLAKARLVEIERAGHHVLLDQPERLRAVLEEFLAEAVAAS
ncbi:MAG: alpha/beta fold hydrolase [Deltaproteobacteria bacterium]|jgi:pimeloyl-ACP methyl ester carboxylesterase|nr:alpha/beta fold hydrolase [Deltaproteobacteria bacterium]MBW2498354.1 alpha/beta fold hydrolase [Deltaproteobacteria bacterium]